MGVFRHFVSLEELPEKLEHLSGGFDQAISDSTLAAATRTLPMAVRATPVDTGLMKSSWEVVKPIGKPKDAWLVNDAPYAGVVEQGSRPFTPPLKPLVDWAERKAADLGIAPKPSRGRASLSKDQRRAAFRVAIGIRRKFQRQGYTPRWVMRRLLPKAARFLQEEIDLRVQAIMSKGGKG